MASEGGTLGRNTPHTQNQKSLYGAGTKGLFAQWPFALKWGVAGMLGPEQGHKHQILEPSTEGGGSINVSLCAWCMDIEVMPRLK